MPWPLEDPSPVDDLPSDIAFGTWLESLHPSVVLQDLEPALNYLEKSRLAYLRRRLLVSHHPQPQRPPFTLP